MAIHEKRRSVAQKIEALAATINDTALDKEMGAMCHGSFFEQLRNGAKISQESIDEASKAFTTLTERLMPAGLVHQFIQQACAMRLQPEIEEAELVPGFTYDEGMSGSDATARLANPMKKFTHQEVMDCLQWNQAQPHFPVAIAHLIKLIQTYNELLCNLVARRSPPAAEKLSHFSKQWASKNVLKFVNAATFVSARQKAAGGPLVVNQTVLRDAMNLLNHSGAFTWSAQQDTQIKDSSVRRIHCPAQSFLHKLVVNEGSLMTLIEFIDRESSQAPCADELKESLSFMRAFALKEQAKLSSLRLG